MALCPRHTHKRAHAHARTRALACLPATRTHARAQAHARTRTHACVRCTRNDERVASSTSRIQALVDTVTDVRTRRRALREALSPE